MDRREAYLNSMLPLLEQLIGESWDDIARHIAEQFRKRRVEKNLSRKEIADQSGVPEPTVARFEQKALISLESLIKLASALGYAGELKSIFDVPKFTTMAELLQIRDRSTNKRAYPKRNRNDKD